jgi:hypothetical protein
MQLDQSQSHASPKPVSTTRRMLGLAWLLGCIAAAALVMFGPWGGGSPTPPTEQAANAQPLSSIQPVSADTPSHLNQQASKPIEQIRLGDRVIARNPEVTDEERALFEDPDPLRWRAVELSMLKDNGQRLDITLLRHEMWFWLNDAEVGSQVYIDLPEMGAEGLAEVLSISLCPYLQPGEGSIVTGTFHHESDQPLLEISVEGADEPIVGTSNHPFWSEDRQEFVEAGELKPGERLRTANDEIRHITRITRGPPPQAVYNIEVHGEHVYHVGTAGVLVHNSYLTDYKKLLDKSKKYGGHTRPRHVKKNKAYHEARLARDSHIPQSSTYIDDATAAQVIMSTIKHNRGAIHHWLKNTNNPGLPLRYSGTEVIGSGLPRGATELVDLTNARIILRRSPDDPNDWFLLTSLPE